ncbi:pleckstrin homology domain-containing family O member 2 [Melanotaenia boesemani]|uniref:pleckstrin homology domain-containing family O member 2 n=1 Tax=Melanotaenia boesemani TaxID=1250792 RepID=UPI001C047603|nr:pleckstrin homology domain-containing family O member 2 [Melanotaenia boesemani]
MEDGTKEEPAQHEEPKFLSKAGWVKKAHGRVLASYKDRYIHVEKTEIVVFENEGLQTCLERFDLENYDKCHELKSPFKKKHRLVLIRSPKSGNAVHNVKLQVQTAEEKEAWIKALSDAISRAKNKVFDEVKVDKISHLEHVTRSRPKGNRNRRPPTRIHMKEVADVSSDGILRLDLDLEGAVMPNGTHHSNVDGTVTPKKAKDPTPQPNSDNAAEKPLEQSAEQGSQSDPQLSPQKKAIKPPMPPTKEANPSSTSEDEPAKDEEKGPEKKVPKPPMPPSKEVKPCSSPAEEAAENQKPDAKKKTCPPPTPPNRPSSAGSLSNLAEILQSTSGPHPPTPPSKEKKPSHPAVASKEQVKDTAEEDVERTVDSRKESETDEADQLVSEETLPHVRDGEPESPEAEGEASVQESVETVSCDTKPQTPTAPQRNPGPEKPAEPDVQHKESLSDSADDNASSSSPQTLELPPHSEVPSVVVSVEDPLPDSFSLSPLHCHLSGDKRKKAEEKSVDSGQHSDDESEGSGSEDTLAASTAALRGSHPGLDVLDTLEDDIQLTVQLGPPAKPQMRPNVISCRLAAPYHKPPKPSVKPRSASIGDLLSESSSCTQTIQPSRGGDEGSAPTHDDVIKLETEVALEMKTTSKLLSQAHGEDYTEVLPEDLLAKAMEKLRKADHVLREVKKIKFAKNARNRMSW